MVIATDALGQTLALLATFLGIGVLVNLLIVYVVGAEQRFHFQQLFAALDRLGLGETRCVHVDFGMVTLPEGRMSTRRGPIQSPRNPPGTSNSA